MNTQLLSEESLKNGRRWTFREDFDLASGGSVDIAIANELASDELRLVSIRISPDNAVVGTTTANVDGVGGGTTLPFRNDRINGGVDSKPAEIVVESGGSYSGGVAPLPFRTSGASGSGINKTPLNDIPVAVSRIEAGGNLQYTITEDSGNAQTVTFEVVIARR